jgi:hypothetical protein
MNKFETDVNKLYGNEFKEIIEKYQEGRDRFAEAIKNLSEENLKLIFDDKNTDDFDCSLNMLESLEDNRDMYTKLKDFISSMIEEKSITKEELKKLFSEIEKEYLQD